MSYDQKPKNHGDFTADRVPVGSRYELYDGHPIYCAPAGGDHARGSFAGGEAVLTDPAVTSGGFDAGFTTRADSLVAPDVSVDVPDAPGWVKGVPPLAIEYASVGQDEAKLQAKIATLLDAGTRWVWVVRLVGPRRVEVFGPAGVTTHGPGTRITAEGVLKNPVPVEALYDTEAAHRHALQNLLERFGYRSIASVREEGRQEGHVDALRAVLVARGIAASPEVEARITAAPPADVLRWLTRAATASAAADLFDDD